MAPQAGRIGAFRKSKHLQQIETVLEEGKGIAVVGYCDFPLSLIQCGSDISTNDISRISRSDCAWSVIVLFTVAEAMAYLKKAVGMNDAKISLYYDRKDLTQEHRAAVEKYVAQRLAEIPNTNQFTGSIPSAISIPRIEQIPKNKKSQGGKLNHLQVGTFLADRICSLCSQIINGSSQIINGPSGARIFVNNFTDEGIGQMEDFVEVMKRSSK